MFKFNNAYYMVYSRWKCSHGFQGWVTDCTFMMTCGGRNVWENRNRQRIGTAWTDAPEGEWVNMPNPVIDLTSGGGRVAPLLRCPAAAAGDSAANRNRFAFLPSAKIIVATSF